MAKDAILSCNAVIVVLSKEIDKSETLRLIYLYNLYYIKIKFILYGNIK